MHIVEIVYMSLTRTKKISGEKVVKATGKRKAVKKDDIAEGQEGLQGAINSNVKAVKVKKQNKTAKLRKKIKKKKKKQLGHNNWNEQHTWWWTGLVALAVSSTCRELLISMVHPSHAEMPIPVN